MPPTNRDLALAQQFMVIVPLVIHGLAAALREGSQGDSPITLAQMRCLASLSGGPRSIGELAGAHDVSPPTMSRLVTALVERGWVERARDPVDRRHVIVALSDAGAQVWRRHERRAAQYLAELLGELDEPQKAALHSALSALQRACGHGSERGIE